MSPRPPHGLPGLSQATRETPQTSLSTKPQAASTETPRLLNPLSRSTLDPHLARWSGLEWGLPAVIPGWALPALLFKSAGERKYNNNKKGAAERRGPAVTNAVTQAPLPPQVLISLAPPAEPPHHGQAGDTTSPRPAVLGTGPRNPPAARPRRCPAAPGSLTERIIPDQSCGRSQPLLGDTVAPCHRPGGLG